MGTGRAEGLAKLGITAEQARAGYADISYELPIEAQIAQRFGDTVSQTELEATKFGVAGAAEAQRKLRQLNSSEEGLFAGKPSASKESLSRSTVGSY